MRPIFAAVLACLSVAACSPPPATKEPVETRTPITFSQLLEKPRASADRRIAYGADPLQFGELWIPRGRAPPCHRPDPRRLLACRPAGA